MRIMAAALGLGAAMLFAQAPRAETLRFVSNATAQQFTTSRDLVLNGETGATSIKFKVEKRGAVVMTFSANCYIDGNPGAVVSVVIYVKLQGKGAFKALPPTYAYGGFCRANGAASNSEMSSILGGMEMPAGTHEVKVTAEPANLARAYLSASALHIQN